VLFVTALTNVGSMVGAWATPFILLNVLGLS